MRIRTGFSFRTAVGHLDDVLDRLIEIGHQTAVITDRNSTFGYRRFRDECKKKNLRAAYGVELAVIDDFAQKKPILNYWTFLAKSEIKSVNSLVDLATSNTIKDSCIHIDAAIAAKDVIKIIGERATHSQLQKCAGQEDVFLALSPATPIGHVSAAVKNKIPLIAVSDNYFPRKEDLEFYRAALGRRASTQTYQLHIQSDDEWLESVKLFTKPEQAQEALKNRDAVLSRLNADLLNAEMYKPPRPKTLRQMCEEGAVRVGVDLNDPVYSARLDRELGVIEEKDFADYFYIVADIVNWAKDHMIVGPARGSSCGSLVCYLLNITAVDPIPYGLIFERFIDINRKDMPDIDIDFDDKERDKVFEYMADHYKSWRVARLGTVGMFKQRSALKQVATVFGIPIGMVEKALTASGDALSLKETFDTTEAGQKLIAAYPEARVAERLENHPNVASQHAAGMLVTQEAISNYVAIDQKTHAAMVDKKDAEALNLLKIDALGLTQLSTFARTLKLLGVSNPKSGWLEKIPLDDPKAFAVLNERRYSGIFQFAGRALQGLTNEITVENIEDIVSITALARPGPMNSGGAGDWVKRRSGREPVSYIHPLMEELTKDTYGVLIYQEQVMHICRRIGGLSWGDTSDIRRAIGKSMGADALEKYYEMFKEGAAKNGVEEYIARKIWNDIVTFGRYGFNRSHAVAYGLVSYYCCWLKAHHNIEFCAATLDSEVDPHKQILLLRELKEEGVDYIPVDLKRSTNNWEVTEKDGAHVLLGPLTTIKGLGPRFVNEIIEARAKGEQIRPALQKRLNGAKTEIDSLYPIIDAAKRNFPNFSKEVRDKDYDLKDLRRQRRDMADVQMGDPGIFYCVGILKRMTVKDENDEQSVARRNGRILPAPTNWLSMFFADDTDEIFAKIDRFSFEKMGKPILERGGIGKAIYLIKARTPENFRMLNVLGITYIGNVED